MCIPTGSEILGEVCKQLFVLSYMYLHVVIFTGQDPYWKKPQKFFAFPEWILCIRHTLISLKKKEVKVFFCSSQFKGNPSW